MKKFPIIAVLLVVGLASSCATVHATRYAYGKSSVYADARENDASRAWFGIPLILFGLGWDAATFPAQALFGVWPMWGDASLSMDPDVDMLGQ